MAGAPRSRLCSGRTGAGGFQERQPDRHPEGPAFTRRAVDGEHWLVNDGHDRLPTVLIDGANAATPAAVVIPLDADFAARADAALRLWRAATGQSRRQSQDPLTPQQRRRLVLALRALDGRLAGNSYRVIAQGLFGEARTFRPRLIARFVLNRCGARTIIARDTAEALANHEPPALASRIGQRVIFADAPRSGRLVSEVLRSERAAREVAALAAEIQRIAR